MQKKRLPTTIIALGFSASALIADDHAAASIADKASYGIGQNIGQSIQQQGIPDLNVDKLLQGLEDAFSGKDPLYSAEEIGVAMEELQQRQIEAQAEAAAASAAEAEAFLAANAKKEDVMVTDSGLQYEIIEAADGPKPNAEDVVVTHYRGTLLNGEEFDSSYQRNQPAEFPVNRVIPGWTEALQMMSVGSKWKLYIPSELAYGPQSPSPAIPPNSTLVFDIELLEIK